MEAEIVKRFSTDPNKVHIKVQCDNGDTIRLEIVEIQNAGTSEVQMLVTSVDTYPHIQPKASNQVLIHFKD